MALKPKRRSKPRRRPRREVTQAMKDHALSFRCYTCGAGVGEYCTRGADAPHPSRLPGRDRPVTVGWSVRAIPAASETSRPRH